MSMNNETRGLRSISGSSSILRNADVGHMLELREKLAAAESEVQQWKKNIIPFLAVHAGAYGRDHYGEGCMHFTHYDMLAEAGARMDSFKRCGDPEKTTPPNQ